MSSNNLGFLSNKLVKTSLYTLSHYYDEKLEKAVFSDGTKYTFKISIFIEN